MASWPELHDLIWLFEAEPKIEFPDIGWPVSQATFVTARGSWRVICTIAPYVYTVDLRLGQGGRGATSFSGGCADGGG